MFATLLPNREQTKYGLNFQQKLRTSRDGLVRSTEIRKGLKNKKTILQQESCDKERLETTLLLLPDYAADVVFQTFFNNFSAGGKFSCVVIPSLCPYF